MKCDMDLARAILLTIEGSKKFPFHLDKDGNLYKKFKSDFTGEQIRYHLELLREAGLVRYSKTGYTYEVENGDFVQEVEEEAISCLTWEGHEFVEAARDPNRWDEAKTIAREKTGSLAFDIVKTILTQLARQAVGL